MPGSGTPRDREAALASLHVAWTDLSAAHRRALDAAAELSGARHSRAVELAELIGDGLAFCRRLSTAGNGDIRADEAGQ
jgi:hypothetical protein